MKYICALGKSTWWPEFPGSVLGPSHPVYLQMRAKGWIIVAGDISANQWRATMREAQGEAKQYISFYKEGGRCSWMLPGGKPCGFHLPSSAWVAGNKYRPFGEP